MAGRYVYEIVGEDSKFRNDLKKSEQKFDKFGNKLKDGTKKTKGFSDALSGAGGAAQGLGGQLGSMVAGFAGLAGGIAVVVKTFKKFVELAKESLQLAEVQAEAEAKLEGVIRTTGKAAGFNAVQLKEMASGLQSVTTYGDEAILGMQSVLLTFKNIRGEAFERTTKAVLDLSATLGQDLKSTALQVGKALEDPARRMSALERSGVSFTETQKEMAKAMQAAGDMAGAQNIVLEALEGQVGGVAEEMAKASSGPMKQYKNAAGDLKEEIGFLLQEGMNPWLIKLTELKEVQAESLRTMREFREAMDADNLKQAATSLDKAQQTLSAVREQMQLIETAQKEGVIQNWLGQKATLGTKKAAEDLAGLRELEETLLGRIAELQDETTQRVEDQVNYNKELVEYWKKIDPEFAKRLERQEKEEEITNRVQEARQNISRELEIARQKMDLALAIGEDYNFQEEKRKIVLKEINDLFKDNFKVHGEDLTLIEALLTEHGLLADEAEKVTTATSKWIVPIQKALDEAVKLNEKVTESSEAYQKTALWAKRLEDVNYKAVKQDLEGISEELRKAKEYTADIGIGMNALTGLADTFWNFMDERLDENQEYTKEALRKQAIARKALAIFEAGVNTLSAVIEALPNIPLAITVGLLGAAKTGLIAATPVPSLAQGAEIRPTAEGSIVRVAEAGQTEAVMPLTQNTFNQFAEGIMGALNNSGRGGNIHLTINLDGKQIYDGIYEMSRRGQILIDQRAVVKT